jgi:DNA mismatch repair protein MutL
MSVIRILSDHLANQIAAGEVVERPASVIKELVENSLDAGAVRVLVQVEGGGTRLLRVVDDGMGMNGDDVLLSFERHATSKLTSESQLAAIATLGFRGEAIPSIASVSSLVIISRLHDQATGTRAEVRYGTLHGVHEDGCAKGTIVEVRNLFANMPARKKFLKSVRTELFHIGEVIKNQALAFPEVSFTLEFDGRSVFEYPGNASLEERVRAVFGYQGKLLQITAPDEQEDGIRINGFLLLPESVSSPTAKLRLLVGGRPVQDRMLRHAVIAGLQGFLMKGYSPAGVVVLNLRGEDIDVNVHPAKREIRFHRSQEVHRLVVSAVRGAVYAHQEEVRNELFSVGEEESGTDKNNYIESSEVGNPSGDGDNSSSEPGPNAPPIPVSPPQYSSFSQPADYMISREPESVKTDLNRSDYSLQSAAYISHPQLTGDSRKLTLIGHIFDLYLLCTRSGTLVVIDQHAAHERIIYTKLVHAYLEGVVPCQNLLFPVTVDLPPDLAELAEQRVDELTGLGVQAEPFGGETWVIKGIPAMLSGVAPDNIFLQSLEALKTVSSCDERALPSGIDELFARTACRAAIRGGDSLAPVEILALLEEMEKSEFFSHCPHGRPVIRSFDQGEIEKWFHRS